MDFQSYLKENAQKVDRTLQTILLDFVKESNKSNPKLLPFAKELVNSCKGGKRIRGVLCKLGYTLAGGKSAGILKVAAAWEIVHTALLIHDDIIDKSLTRRGQPSLYKALGGNHYGVSQAISLGDIGLYLPVKLISESNFSNEVKVKTLNFFSQILINTGWGQVMDIEKDRDVNFVNLFKTAKYTIAGPLQIGAILAGGEDKLIKKLGTFGEEAGIAFQLQDDILDGDAVSKEQTRLKALDYANKAKKMIPQITKDQKLVKTLESLADYLINRKK